MVSGNGGKLYAIGAGPGAPDLLTLRAVRILAKVDIVLAASSAKNDYSLAYDIVKQHLSKDARTVILDFPMTRDEDALEEAWQKAAQTTLDFLDKGLSAAFLTLGDPLVYSTFVYLYETIRRIAPATRVEIVPGITSFQAAAARTDFCLCRGREPVVIVSGIDAPEKIRQMLELDCAAVILKVYRNYRMLEEILAQTGRLTSAIAVTRAEQGEEKVQRLPFRERPDYMTLILTSGERDGELL